MSLYNAVEFVASSWMDEKFFKGVIRSFENRNEIDTIDIRPACMKGEHYASIMFRGKVHFNAGPTELVSRKSLSLKTLPEEWDKFDMLSQSLLFETEINMYIHTLPKITNILAERGDSISIAPSSLETHKMFVLEDLCEQGYEMMRNRYPIETEVKTIYRRLAKVHAVSHALGEVRILNTLRNIKMEFVVRT